MRNQLARKMESASPVLWKMELLPTHTYTSTPDLCSFMQTLFGNSSQHPSMTSVRRRGMPVGIDIYHRPAPQSATRNFWLSRKSRPFKCRLKLSRKTSLFQISWPKNTRYAIKPLSSDECTSAKGRFLTPGITFFVVTSKTHTLKGKGCNGKIMWWMTKRM